MAKERALSPVAQEVYEALKGAGRPVTLAEIKEIVSGANSAHLTALKTRGLVSAEQVEKETVRVVKSKVNVYFIESDDSENDETDTEDEDENEDDESDE